MFKELRFTEDEWAHFVDNARIIGYKVFGRKTITDGLFKFKEYIFMGGCPCRTAERLHALLEHRIKHFDERGIGDGD